MGNTLGTTNAALIALQAMRTLFTQFPVLSQITMDPGRMGEKTAKYNQQVISRVISPSAAIDHDPAAGYASIDMTAVDVPVTIDEWFEHTYSVTDLERSSTDRDLIKEFADASAHALGTKLVELAFSKIKAAKYPLSYPVSAANFDRDDVVKVRTLLQKAKIADLNRFMVLNPDYAEGLGIDQTIVGGINNPGVTTLQDGKLPRIHNFDVSEFTDLPENDEKLVGIAGNKESIILATRVPDVPGSDVNVPGTIKQITEPNTGITVQFRGWYDIKMGKEYRTLTVMAGVAEGLSAAGECRRLVRIVKP